MDTNIDQLFRQYLEQKAEEANAEANAQEFERLSRKSQGDSYGWKFNREELYERR